MKKTYLARAAAGIFACVMLLTGCQSSKFGSMGGESPTTQDSAQVNDVEMTKDTDAVEGTSEGTGENTTDNSSGDITGIPSEVTSDPEIDQDKNAPVKAKALYLTGWTVGSTKNVDHYIELANTTEINSYVVDIKDDDGFVGYESQVPEVQASGTWKKKYNADSVLKAFHDNDIYVIGRVVVFKDPLYSVKRPDLAIKNASGGVWKDKDGLSWLNPYNEEAWEYTVKIAKEAVEKGFDEIQFDYIRFPSDGKKSQNYSGADQEKEKYQAICDFLAYAKEHITEVPISADVYGIILESPEDREGIGQYLEYIGKDIDYISPMVYPSHYAAGQIVNKVAFPKPDLDPYGVVYNSLVKGRERIAQVSGYKAGVRAYLQDFNAPWLGKGYYQEYGAEQVRQQIQAVYDAGYEEWIFWDSKNTYHEEAFEKE
jgi:hypothetical protein